MKCDKYKKNEVKIVIQGVGNFCLDCNNEMMADQESGFNRYQKWSFLYSTTISDRIVLEVVEN